MLLTFPVPMFISLPLLPSAALHFLQKSEKFSQSPERSLQTMPYSLLPSFLSPLFIWAYFVWRSSCFKRVHVANVSAGPKFLPKGFGGLRKHVCHLWMASACPFFSVYPHSCEWPENSFAGNKQWGTVAVLHATKPGGFRHPVSIRSLKSLQ